MTALASPTASSPSPSSSQAGSPPPPNTNFNHLPPLKTNVIKRRTEAQRPPSFAKSRMSSYSNASLPSIASQNISRPASHVFPAFHSSLPYAFVRDFAYPEIHPMHYGPPPIVSGLSTPASEYKRFSDPPPANWDGSRASWSAAPRGEQSVFGSQQLPATSFGDGPPYSEDEDLHSPVVTTAKHRKHKSSTPGLGGSGNRSPGMPDFTASDGQRAYFTGVSGNGSQTYYFTSDADAPDGPGGEIVTYPPDQYLSAPGSQRRNSHFAAEIQRRPPQESPAIQLEDGSSDELSDADYLNDPSRYSKDYQFTIASPDEEMHGKAVALFDFARENENELPLVEGQVILVSYRHGQGWLVAEDPKTGESGLVPEEYVRLLRDIEGGWSSLSGELQADSGNGLLSPVSAGPTPDSASPTPAENKAQKRASDISHSPHPSNGSNNPAVVSTFSTSSRDLDPYPLTERGTERPQILQHRDSRKGSTSASTPTATSPTKT